MILIEDLRRAVKLSDEARLEALRAEVIAQWESLTGYLWDRRVGYVELFENDLAIPASRIWPRLRPQQSFTSVEESSSAASWSALSASGYLVDDGALLRLGANWATYVRLTYTGGYDGIDTPADIRHALITQAQFLVSRLGGDKVSVSSQNFEGGGGVFHKPDWHPTFMAAASSRRRWIG